MVGLEHVDGAVHGAAGAAARPAASLKDGVGYAGHFAFIIPSVALQQRKARRGVLVGVVDPVAGDRPLLGGDFAGGCGGMCTYRLRASCRW